MSSSWLTPCWPSHLQSTSRSNVPVSFKEKTMFGIYWVLIFNLKSNQSVKIFEILGLKLLVVYSMFWKITCFLILQHILIFKKSFQQCGRWTYLKASQFCFPEKATTIGFTFFQKHVSMLFPKFYINLLCSTKVALLSHDRKTKCCRNSLLDTQLERLRSLILKSSLVKRQVRELSVKDRKSVV